MKKIKEEWMPVRGFEGRYEVSNYGEVRNVRTGRILKGHESGKFYEQVSLFKNGKQHALMIHRIVYEAFVCEIPDGLVIDHINGIRNDNRLHNLRVVTQKENIHNPVTFPRHLEALRLQHANPEYQKNHAEAMEKLHSDPEWKKKHLEGIQRVTKTDEWKEKQRNGIKEFHSDKEKRIKWLQKCTESSRKLAQDTEWRRNHTEAIRKRCNKRVLQIDMNTGEVIKTWESIEEAKHELNINHISDCCRGTRKKAGGFKWRFAS